MAKIDPDYESGAVEKETEKVKRKTKEIKIKGDNKSPASIGSVKSVVKLLTGYEPDILASIMIGVSGGRKVPLFSLLVS